MHKRTGKHVSLSVKLKSLLKLVTDSLHLVLLPEKRRQAELTFQWNTRALTSVAQQYSPPHEVSSSYTHLKYVSHV